MKSLLLFLLITPLALFAQNAKIDSLKRVIETTKVDTVKGRTLCRLCSRLTLAGELEEGYKEGRKGLNIVQKARDLKGQYTCLNNLGQNRMAAGDYQACLELHQRRLELSEKAGDDSEAARSMLDAGNVLHQQGNLDKALDYMFKALRICGNTKDMELAAKCYNSIGIIYYSKEDMTNALKYYQKSLDIKIQLGDLKGQVSTLSNMANIYSEQNEHHRAILFYERCLAALENSGDVINQGMVLINLALSQKELMQFEAAADNMKAGLYIFEKSGHRAGESVALGNLGLLYIDIGQPAQARAYAGRSSAISREIGHMEFSRFSAEILYKADSALADWKGAFEAHRIFKIYSDSLKNDEKSQEIGRLEAEYEADKEREVLEANQQAQIERYNWVIGSSVGGLVLMMALALTFLRGRQKEKRANSELRALNDEISQQKSEIEAQRDEISRQNVEILERNEEISKQNETLEQQRRQLAETNGELAEKNLKLKLAQEQLILEHEQREQAQRMAGIGEVSTIVAHEVNTPLGAIKAGAQNLIDRLTQSTSVPQLKPLIQRAAQAKPLSSREERAAIGILEQHCEAAGFAKPEDAARQLVNCGLHDLEDAETLGLLAREPLMLAQLASTGAFMAQAANIQQAAERAASIVSALKTYTTLAGASSAENAGASVSATLGLVLKLYDYYLSQGIELKIDPMNGLPDVTLDAGALSQVWTKLLLNSIYGMNRKGKLEIKFIVTERHLRVQWLDDGPSPSDEAMARAFEPGVALRETDPPIDLWLCSAFVEGEAGGRIMASIPPDGGLVVELLLPKAE